MEKTTERLALLPPWVGKLFEDFREGTVRASPANPLCPFELTAWHQDAPYGWKLLVGRIADVGRLSDADLCASTAAVYRAIMEAVQDDWCPVRCWNFIPEIDREVEGGLDRYMVFNAGRHEALASGFGPNTPFDAMPTATAVGLNRSDLEVFCLASQGTAKAVDNPRQRPAYQYSERYGPLPPCFSRATVVANHDGSRALLIGGTASVTGEDTQHLDSLKDQVSETFRNLETLVEEASQGTTTLEACSRDVRVYCRNENDLQRIEGEVRQRFNGLESFEMMQATICRPDLLVEIEAFCALPPG